MSGRRTRCAQAAPRRPPSMLIRDAHALDPRAGIDARLDVRLRDGVIAELGDARHARAAPRARS